ncbi:triosephosphate isomerase [Stylonychia lemnae]|uniref:triose-phosphate isomerase n=1 Tax=Stylonychia lemnae TaxID=5949 RepID=A0A078B8A1_STYLE|nr:triosephosphate isomerase [Stylonychia lemnae]|eukprot:CDW90416.1 triosephosphate isomerase [Stylonychia lemnae]
MVNVPCYSMGSAPRMREAKTTSKETPGPGQYKQVNLIHKLKAPQWVIGSEKRASQMSQANPGPGQYNTIAKDNVGPKYHMGLKTNHSMSVTNLNPGPGNYNISRSLGQVGYIFGLKTQQQMGTHVRNPGPGAYSLRGSFNHIPGSKIGTSQRDDDIKRAKRLGSPGPGTYRYDNTIVHSALRQDAPKFGFGTADRDKNPGVGTVVSPGPGSYQHKQIMGHDGPKRSMTSRRPMSADSRNSPGPGQYTPAKESVAKAMPKYSIGHEQRDTLGLNHMKHTPAPNQYMASTATLTRQPSWVMGSSQRNGLGGANGSPGPGNYNIPSKMKDGPKYVMGLKGRDLGKEMLYVPGPGQYHPDFSTLKQKHPTFKIGSEQRIPGDKTTIRQVPGPGNYSPQKRPQSAAPKYGFGSSTRQQIKQTKDYTPGPGAYKVPARIQDVPSYLLPNRSQEFKFNHADNTSSEEIGNVMELLLLQKNLLKELLTKLSLTMIESVRQIIPLLNKNVDVVVAPASVHLTSVKSLLTPLISVAAQNCGAQGNGAFTGEVSADILVDLGLQWVILGHSERRSLYNESSEVVAKKTKYALSKGLNVILCIGEKLDEREAGTTNDVLKAQLDACKDSIENWGKVVVAYEPVWAIGTGKVASPEQAQETQAYVRSWLRDSVSEEVANNTRIIYGGSVTETNCAELIQQQDVDGFLVGGASLKPGFADIIKAVSSAQ